MRRLCSPVTGPFSPDGCRRARAARSAPYSAQDDTRTDFRIWVWWSAHHDDASCASFPVQPGKWSPFPLHSLPRNGSALRVLTDSSVLRYMEYSSDLPQAVAYGGAIVPCIYTLHRVESLVRFHYTLPVFCEAPTIFRRSAKFVRKIVGFSFYGFRNIFSLLTYCPYMPSLLNALWRILPSGFRRFAPQSATLCTANNSRNIPALR